MKLERIVAGIDFSDPSAAAARWVARFFAPESAIRLVYAIEVPRPPEFLNPILPPQAELLETLRTGGEQRLRELGTSLGTEHLCTDIRVGKPAECLADAAREHQADLLVVGEHGRDRSFGTLLGSTAEQLVRRSPTPVLLARTLPDGAPRTILLPVDPSGMADTVLQWGRWLRDRFDADVIALYTVSPRLYGRVSVVSSPPRAQKMEQDLLASAHEWLRQRVERAGLASDERHAVVSFGDPGHEIDAAVRRYGADLVVMGSHGAGSAGSIFLGSTAGTVLRGGPCSVLIVHGPEDGPDRAT